ncbi:MULTISPECIES: rRNA maturation RNase YbeY [unclassified Treponema]|uniref:rRNA maturation RNase YbeY n=1 Tax=unclassified Treponema TaxID=2638727 RepID=UPI0020A235B8|nr:MULTISPECIES: rRNA maturation RNase YbeY [unclassified Treponema]UTC65852.1 rRNA maturation RNase YbeY [Treponema sp. OMZ 789]UTC68580.1 rRNA maturation RNase YbeY [Treponema sp. OMZ 790]UTC71311.1 rRNA maturation RNase YbeY [Treponema sp. OMZ 791]
MSNSISVSFNDEPPGAIDPLRVENFISTVLNDLNLDNWDISLLFCDDGFIRNLNKQYRNIDSPTDVLSFEQGDEYFDDEGEKRFMAGDIVISLDSLNFNAEEFNVGIDEELKRLIVHGILHLNGMDHSDNSPEQEMLKFQEKLLGQYKNIIIYRV